FFEVVRKRVYARAVPYFWMRYLLIIRLTKGGNQLFLCGADSHPFIVSQNPRLASLRRGVRKTNRLGPLFGSPQGRARWAVGRSTLRFTPNNQQSNNSKRSCEQASHCISNLLSS